MQPSLCPELSADDRAQLLDIARASIRHGIESGRALLPDAAGLGENMRAPAAVFITLTRNGDLRDCIGSLQASQPLAEAVASSAFNAAMRDPRFAPVRGDELEQIDIEISVLSEMQPIEAESRQALLAQLETGVDGLLLEDRGHRATFLPKVWEKMRDADEFLDHLMLKAGLGERHWSSSIRFHRYHTLSFAEK